MMPASLLHHAAALPLFCVGVAWGTSPLVEEVVAVDPVMLDTAPSLLFYSDGDVSHTLPLPPAVEARHAATHGRYNRTTLQPINFWHIPMMNDDHRYLAYRDAMRRVIGPRDVVLEIGGGSGLLAVAAARMRPLHVYTIEFHPHIAKVARHIIAANGEARRVTVIEGMSNAVQPIEMERPTVLISETIGVNVLAEGQLEWIRDARQRLLAPGGRILPGSARQYVTLFESPTYDRLTRVSGRIDGIDLTGFNVFRDTSRVYWSRNLGFPASQLGLKEMSAPIKIIDINFYNVTWGALPAQRVFRVRALHDGVVHGAFTHFDLYEDACARHRMLTTHPHANQSLPREMAWGVGLATLQDERRWGGVPLRVRRGDLVKVTVTFNRVHFNIEAHSVVE